MPVTPSVLVASLCAAAVWAIACSPIRDPTPVPAPDADEVAEPKDHDRQSTPGRTKKEVDRVSQLSWQVDKHLRAISLRVPNADHIQPRDWVDLMAVLTSPQDGSTRAVDLAMRIFLLAVDTPSDGAPGERVLTCEVIPEEAEVLTLAQQIGTLSVSLSNPEDVGGHATSPRISMASMLAGQILHELHQKRLSTFQRRRMPNDAPRKMAAPPSDWSPSYDAACMTAYDLRSVRLSLIVDKRARALTIQAAGLRHVAPYDHVDLLWTGADPKTGQTVCSTLMRNLIVARIDAPDRLTVLVLPEEAKALSLAANTGHLTVTLRNPGDGHLHERRAPTTLAMLLNEERALALLRTRYAPVIIQYRAPSCPWNDYVPPQLPDDDREDAPVADP